MQGGKLGLYLRVCCVVQAFTEQQVAGFTKGAFVGEGLHRVHEVLWQPGGVFVVVAGAFLFSAGGAGFVGGEGVPELWNGHLHHQGGAVAGQPGCISLVFASCAAGMGKEKTWSQQVAV